MRELKFRAWNKKRKRMHPILHLHLASFEGLWATVKGYNIIEDKDVHLQIQPKDINVMQYTGLKDRNGKEIYEGDIVVKDGYIWFDDGRPNYRGTVEWIYSQWQVIAHCINPEKQGISNGMNEGLNDDGFEDGKNSNWEVIGNIYENPELLKEDNNG